MRTRHRASDIEELRQWRDGLDKALRKPPRRRRRALRVLAGGLVLLVLVGLAGGFAYWQVISGLFTRTNLSLDPASGRALNVLIVGSDSRDGLTDPDDVERFGTVGGKRADTIILAQLVPAEQRGVLLHFPRDLHVTIPVGGRSTQARINSSYAHGPQTVINTVTNLTGIPINHYMEVDISGFRGMVDAIGGVSICLEDSMYDSKLNFRLPEGTSRLDGNQALSFVRARYATPDGDFGRIKRQQQFIRAVMDKVGQPSVLGNPLRVNELARAFAKNVTVDQYFQLDDLVRLAVSLRRVGPEQLETFSVPGRITRSGGQSVVRMDTDEAEKIFSALRNHEDPLRRQQQQQQQQAAAEPAAPANAHSASDAQPPPSICAQASA